MSARIYGLLIAHSQKVLLAVHAFKSAAEAWQRGDQETLGRQVEELSNLEKEADSLRRAVTRELAHSDIDHAMSELFRRLVHYTDDVADTARRAGRFLLIIHDLLLPTDLKGDLVKMASLSQAAMANLAEAIHCLSEPAEQRLEYAANISELEESVDDIEFEMQRKANQLQVDTWSAIMFWRLILTTARIADSVEDAADELLAYESED